MINIDTKLISELSCEAFYVICHLAKYLNSDLSCFPSKNKLEYDTKFGRHRLDKAIAELIKKGHIQKDTKRRKDGAYTSNLYIFTTDFLSVYVNAKGKNVSVVGFSDNGYTDNGSTDVGCTDNKVLSIREDIDQKQTFDPLNNESPTNKKEESNPDWQARFESFWDTFGNKKGKKKAMTAFKNLSKTKQLSCTNEETISQYKSYLAKTGISQVHPTTWINGERWEDDFSVKNANVVNTDEALNDRLLTQDQNASYQRYIEAVINSMPNLWKSKCKVLSKSEWFTLNYEDEKVIKNIRIAMTKDRARLLRQRIHELFEKDHFSRAKFPSLYEAIISDYKNHLNHEKTLVA